MSTGLMPRLSIALIGLAVFATGAQATVVGRVLLSAGDTVAVRDGRDVRLQFGSPVEHNDVLRTGAASSLQVRFADESLLSMRENSQLGIEDYRFTGQQDGSERAIFRLVKGGFRKVTGLIGRLNRQHYEVRTPSATIGIRGTDYAVRDCRGDCGADVKDGLYGSVLGMSGGTNRVSLANNAGETVFGKDEHFFVASINTLPQPLLQPPTFVAVKPQGKGQAVQQGGSGSGTETASAGSGVQGESRPATVGAPPAEIMLENLTQYQVTEELAPNGLPAVFPIGTNGLAVSGDGIALGTFLSSVTVSGSGSTEKLSSFISSVQDPETGQTFSLSGQEGPRGSDMTGFASSINGHFGRWIDGTLSFSGGGESGLFTPGTGVHWIYGFDIADPSVFASKTGAFRFNRVAGTNFTDNRGNIATSQSFGPMYVEFRHLVGVLDSIDYNVGGVQYAFRSINIDLQRTPQGLGFVGYIDESFGDPSFQQFGKCIGGACGTGSAADIFLMGGFAGTAGDHAGMSIGTDSPAGTTASVQLFQCPTCASTSTGIPLAALLFAHNLAPPNLGNYNSADVTIRQSPYLVLSGSNLTSFNDYPDIANGTGTVTPLAAINGAFGRWSSATVTSIYNFPGAPATPFNPPGGIHWMYGDVSASEAVFARTGLVNFGHVNGTTPSDTTGGTGTFNSGNIAVNFTNQTGAMTAQWTTTTVGGVVYNWNLNNLPLQFQNEGIAVRLTTPGGAPLINSPNTSCTGGACTGGPIGYAGVRGIFMGTTADHIGTAISTFHPPANIGTSSVQVFSCKPGCP